MWCALIVLLSHFTGFHIKLFSDNKPIDFLFKKQPKTGIEFGSVYSI